MDERLKQRLVGATVLVALAVIIIPELVERPDEPEAPAAGLTIPEAPEVREQPVITLSREPERPVPVLPESAPVDLGDPSPVAEEPGALPFDTDRAPPPVAEAEEEPPRPTGSAIVTASPPQPPPQPQPETERQPPPAPTAEAPRPAKPAVELPKIELLGRSQGPSAAPPAQVARAEPQPARSQGWMIQVGSFSRQENADLQRDRLREAGYPVTVEPVRINGRTLYRVRVGPQGSRAESERVLARLLRETGVNGQVVAPD